MEEEKLVRALNYAKGAGFTEAQFERAKLLMNSSSIDNANQLLLTLLDVSKDDDDDQTKEEKSSNCNINHQTEDNTTNLLLDKISSSSCYSSIASIQSSDSSQNTATLRKIYIDGSNVARTHGMNNHFSWHGIKLCVEWFRSRNHRVKVFVPADKCQSIDDDTETYLNELNALIKTPIGCNDDMFIIKAARGNNGVIVSNDLYRDEIRFNQELELFVHLNRLPYLFDDNQFIPASDPRGRYGPNLDEFLRESTNEAANYDQQSRTGKSHTRYQRSGSLVKPKQYNNLAHRRSLQSTRPSNGLLDQTRLNLYDHNSMKICSYQSPSSSIQSIHKLSLHDSKNGSFQELNLDKGIVEDKSLETQRKGEPIPTMLGRRQAVYKCKTKF